MERQRFETNLYLFSLICPFFWLPWLIHQSFSTSTFSLCVSISSVLPPTIFPFPLSLPSSHLFVSRAQSTSAFSIFRSPALPPFAPAFTFIYLDRFHLGENNPLTGSFIRMTSSNPFVAVGWINPAHSLALTEFIMEAQIQSA